jgi:CDP-diacylglycerol--serine O-phosphatidyltransferase
MSDWWFDVLERNVGRAIPLHPHVLSLVKLVVITPAFAFTALAAPQARSPAPVALFFAFLAFDVVDGVVARARGLESKIGRVLDRVTDVPMLAVIGWLAFTHDVAAQELILAKVALDALAGIASLIKGRVVDDRVRVVVSDVTALALLVSAVFPPITVVTPSIPGEVVTMGAHPFLTRELLDAMLAVNIAFSAVVGLYNAGFLQKRFIADALSGCNALCGVASIWFATQQRPEACLLLLLVGAGFDGLDGAAARRWGGTKFGVFSDDIADAINYAIAPGVALAFALAGVGGVVVGVAYSLLTISRLVFFTLNKGAGDPAFFAGVPSTIGGIVALCALILFRDDRAIVGLLVGVAVVLMVSFDSAYRHLGRVLFALPRGRAVLAFVAGAVLVVGGIVMNPRVPVAIVLALSLSYGFLPQLARFRAVLARKGSP